MCFIWKRSLCCVVECVCINIILIWCSLLGMCEELAAAYGNTHVHAMPGVQLTVGSKVVQSILNCKNTDVKIT